MFVLTTWSRLLIDNRLKWVIELANYCREPCFLSVCLPHSLVPVRNSRGENIFHRYTYIRLDFLSKGCSKRVLRLRCKSWPCNLPTHKCILLLCACRRTTPCSCASRHWWSILLNGLLWITSRIYLAHVSVVVSHDPVFLFERRWRNSGLSDKFDDCL